MNRLLKIILIGVLSITLYVLIISLIPHINYDTLSSNSDSNSSENPITKISLSDSVSTLVVGNRWYGKIVDDGNTRTVYLFRLIPITEEIRGHNLIIFHILFIVILPTSLILLNRKWRKNEKLDQSIVDNSD